MLGPTWIRVTDKGKLRIWFPPKSRVAELVRPVIQDHTYWIAEADGWYVPVEKAQTVYEELFDL